MRERLWIRLAVALLLFVSVGTVGLILVLNAAYQRLSRGEFAALASANAEFIRASRLPATDQLASYLSQMLGVRVEFGAGAATGPGDESVTVPVSPGLDLTLTRERPTFRAVLRRPVTLVTLGAFWALWFVLAAAVVQPYLKSQRLAMLGRMTASLAHEIQNPVAAIRLHAQLLAESQPEAAALIVDEATAIEGLVNQWMFLARPESPRKATLRVSEVLRQVVRLLEPSAEHARVRVHLVVEREQEIQADGRRLAQVFRNIQVNAIQAMPAGGTLEIRVKGRVVTFVDTGPGFSARALSRWGEMMYSEKEGGMGIGLNVARGIIEAHGGRLSVANRPEGGALVRIEL